jgi:hypothetical protein
VADDNARDRSTCEITVYDHPRQQVLDFWFPTHRASRSRGDGGAAGLVVPRRRALARDGIACGAAPALVRCPRCERELQIAKLRVQRPEARWAEGSEVGRQLLRRQKLDENRLLDPP